MKAAIVDELGQVPRCVEVADPGQAEGRVVATVRAAAIKNIERLLVSGEHYGSAQLTMPTGVGLDAVVELPDGRRAYAGAAPPNGTMAEYVSVDPEQIVDVPAGVDDASAAALPNAGVSAWFALEYAGKIAAGQRVLILGATGVTGNLAVSLAKREFGARNVVAIGRNGDRLDWLRHQGADETVRIDTADESAAQPADEPELTETIRRLHHDYPFDVVIDFLWGPPAEKVLAALAGEELTARYQHTRYVQIGEMAGPAIALSAATLRSAGLELVGQGAGSVPPEAFARVGTQVLPRLFAMLADGSIEVETVTRPLADIADAWTQPTGSGVRVVVTPKSVSDN